MTLGQDELNKLHGEVEQIKSSIREIAHDISSPLGVIRMAAYYLQTAKADDAKHAHYCRLIGETVAKMEDGLKQLRALSENPSFMVRRKSSGEE